MAKERIEIDVHGKKISLLEAKLYICGLNLRLIKPKLVGEEEYGYVEWKTRKENINEKARRQKIKEPIHKSLKKKDYIVEILKVKMNEGKRKYCEGHGHKEKKGLGYTPPGFEGAVTHYTCVNCGTIYEKRPGEKIINPFAK